MEDKGTLGTDRPPEGMTRCEENEGCERNYQVEDSAEQARNDRLDWYRCKQSAMAMTPPEIHQGKLAMPANGWCYVCCWCYERSSASAGRLYGQEYGRYETYLRLEPTLARSLLVR